MGESVEGRYVVFDPNKIESRVESPVPKKSCYYEILLVSCTLG